MRTVLNINKDWLFVKDTEDITAREGERINLPHTWNAPDGYDGGNDYFRGSCLYVKELNITLPRLCNQKSVISLKLCTAFIAVFFIFKENTYTFHLHFNNSFFDIIQR